MKESVKLSGWDGDDGDGGPASLLEGRQDFYACHELDQVTKDVLVRWEDVLDRLERDPRLLVRELDWVAKRYLIESYMERKSADGMIRACG